MPGKKNTKNKITSKQQLAGMHDVIKTTFTNPRKRKKALLVILVLFILWLISDLLIGGNIRFYSKWVECGQKPVVSGVTYEGLVPHYEEAPTFPSIRLSPEQFCTPHQAELDGYSANKYQYQFKYTTDQERHKNYIENGANK